MGEQEKCEKSAGHKICKLKKDGKLDEIEQRELNPIVYCNKCQAKADNPSYLCNPRAIKAVKVARKVA